MIMSIFNLDKDDFMKLRNYHFDEYTIHKLVYSLFPKESNSKRDFLYFNNAINPDKENNILILSERKPVDCGIGKIKRSMEMPEEFFNCKSYNFEVQLNPILMNSKSRKRIPIECSDDEALRDWLVKKSSELGFSVQKDNICVKDTGVVSFTRKEQKITLERAIFTGILTVTNRNAFLKSAKNGIGHGKAFGFGLLQLKPLEK